MLFQGHFGTKFVKIGLLNFFELMREEDDFSFKLFKYIIFRKNKTSKKDLKLTRCYKI